MKNFLKTICILTFPFVFANGSDVGSCAPGFAGDETESFGSGANDVIVVKQTDGSLKSTPINVQVGLQKKAHFCPIGLIQAQNPNLGSF